jgi:hypothetical protein
MMRVSWLGLISLCILLVMPLFVIGSDASGDDSKTVEVLVLSTTDTNGELEPCG